MSKHDKAKRAKQFLPFDALKGLREALKEKEKILVEKKVLSQEERMQLSIKLSQVVKGTIIEVVYFENNEYIKLEGVVSKIDITYQTLTIVSKKISFLDLLSIEGVNILDRE